MPEIEVDEEVAMGLVYALRGDDGFQSANDMIREWLMQNGLITDAKRELNGDLPEYDGDGLDLGDWVEEHSVGSTDSN